MGRRDGADDVLVDEHGICHPTERQKSEIRQHLRKAYEDLRENPKILDELDPDDRDDFPDPCERRLFWYNHMIEGIFFNERDKLDEMVNEAVNEDIMMSLYMLLGKHREIFAKREERWREDPNFYPDIPRKYEHLDYSELIRCECGLVMSLDEAKSLQVPKCSNCDNALELRYWVPRGMWCSGESGCYAPMGGRYSEEWPPSCTYDWSDKLGEDVGVCGNVQEYDISSIRT
jgi:hypothetical protein